MTIDSPTEGLAQIVGHAWERDRRWPHDSANPALEWALAVLAEQEPDLTAAAIPIKSDVYVICGNHAAAVRDAHKIVIAALNTRSTPPVDTAVEGEVERLREALKDTRAFIRGNFAMGVPDSRTNAGKQVDRIDAALNEGGSNVARG